MALALNWKNADWSKGIDAFPPRGKKRTIEQKRETALNNKMTQIKYSESTGAAVAQIKYGNKYIERGDSKYFSIGECAKEDYQAAFNEDDGISLKKKLIKPALDNGEFDKEIEAIASAMAERRKKK